MSAPARSRVFRLGVQPAAFRNLVDVKQLRQSVRHLTVEVTAEYLGQLSDSRLDGCEIRKNGRAFRQEFAAHGFSHCKGMSNEARASFAQPHHS